MSNLKLNIPITFEAGAALQIKEDITQSVLDTKGMLTTFNQSATGFDMFLSYLDSTNEHYSGLSINQDKIILDAAYTYIQAPGGGRTEFFSTADGKAKIKTDYITADNVTAKSLSTTGGASTVNIDGGTILCESSSTNTRIEFGIDNNGNAVLKFILNDKVLYNLGPGGLALINFTDDDPYYTDFTLQENNNYINNFNIISGNTIKNYYLPAFTGIFDYSDPELNSADNYSSNFQIDDYYIDKLDDTYTIRSYEDEVTSYTEEISVNNLIIYNNLATICGGKYVLVNFNNNTNMTTVYKYTSGVKKIANIIKYYIAVDDTDNYLDSKPVYDGKTYKGNTISDSYITNTNNYIDNNYYITGNAQTTINKSFRVNKYPIDDYGLRFNNYDSSVPTISSTPYADYISIPTSNSTWSLAHEYFAVDTRALDIRQFTIHKYVNGNEEQSTYGYYIIVYTDSDLSGKTYNKQTIGATYGGKYYDSFYAAVNEDSQFNGPYSFGTEAIKNIYKNKLNAYGILCSKDGIIYVPSGTTFDIDEYFTFLLNSTNQIITT